MLQISCSGSPYEIGYKHGSEGKTQVGRSIEFYASLFQQTAKLDWARVQETALQFEDSIHHKWPAYYAEMRGVAEGAEVQLADILALNVRTEINFGLFSDGCTALSWLTPHASYLAQNWDWMEAQKANLILLTIEQSEKPTIKMVTEAGIIGKIGLNSAGVGVCLNAIRAKGMDPARMPCHLGLRMVLESHSRDEAAYWLDKYGVASACHMLVADGESGGIGLEWSFKDSQKLGMNEDGQVFHSNHYLVPHPGITDSNWLNDSTFRVERIQELAKRVGNDPSLDKVAEMFKDEENFPAAICRKEEGGVQSETLFNIVMDLKAKAARITLGRPVAPEETFAIGF